MLHLVEEKLKDFDPKAPGFPFSRELFWDYPDLNIDLEKHARFVIERVVMRGAIGISFILKKEMISNPEKTPKSF